MTNDESHTVSAESTHGVRPGDPGGDAPGGEIDPDAIAPLPRDHDTPRPLVIAMIALIFLAVAAGFYSIDRLGVAENVLGRPSGTERAGSISSIDEILSEPVKQNLMGRDVMLWRVPVERVVGNYTFWIGTDPQESVPVVLFGERTKRQAEGVTEIREGDDLVIVGSIRPVRDLQLLDEDWSTHQEEWERLERHEIYVSALRVEQLAK